MGDLSRMVGKAVPVAKSVPVADLATLYDALVEFARVREEERTKREEIRAKRDILIRKIREESDIIRGTFTRHFEERRSSIERFFSLLDSAVVSKDEHQMDLALTGILGIVKSSPFMGFAEFSESWKKDGVVLEF